MKAIYAGTFDPPHRGHLDVIRRGLTVVDELLVAVAINHEKRTLFSEAERIALLQKCLGGEPRVRVLALEGLVVELARREQVQFLLRGVRTVADFESESSMALANRQISGEPGIETVFLLPAAELSHVSSTRVKEIARFGGDVHSLLPAAIAREVVERLRAR
ncbi:MAG: pantetheine-phosphate adenylyltransferase [Planctomycetota bacterium]